MIGPKPRIILLDGGQPQAWADAKVGNAVHGAGGLSITIYRNLPDFTGVLAQEWCEIENERLQGLALGVAAAVLLAGLAGLLHAPAFLIFAAATIGLFAGFRFGADYAPESHEVRSHALTALVTVDYDSMTLAAAEAAGAASLAQYSWAHGESAVALIAKMRADYPAVRPWIAANRPLLQSWQALRGPPIGAE